MDNKFDKNSKNISENILLTTILQNTSDMVIIISNDHKILEINAKTEAYFNCKRDDLIGKNYRKLCRDLKNTTVMNAKNNAIEWVRVDLVDSEKKHLACILLGKSSDSQTRAALIEKENKILQNIISSVPGSIYWKNKQGVYLGCNDFMVKTAGLNSKDDIIGKSDSQLWPNQAVTFLENDQQVIQLENAVQVEEQVDLNDGTKRYFTVQKTPLYDGDENIIGIVGNSIEITELKNTQLNLKIAKEAAEASAESKAAFIANMSHDLRTPLTGIIGLSTMIEDGAHNADERQNAQWIHDSGEQLLILLNGILDVVSADNLGEGDVHNISFDLRKLIEDIVQLELPTTKIKQLDLRVEIDKTAPVYIISDRTKLHRVLLNLLGNAIKFTKTGSITIEVTSLDITATDVHLQFGVADTGIGIPLELQDKVFDRFYRVTPSYKGTYTGHGVGLDIAQSYVKLLGGHITLTSQEGVGTTFHFDLPCKIGHKEDVVLQQEVSAHDVIPPRYENYHIPALVVNTKANQVMLDNPNVPYILLIEDNPIALRVLQSLVVAAGCRFESASDGEHALEIATSHDFDLIFSDIGLPGISGYEFTSRFREWEITQHKKAIFIIGLTAHVRESVVKKCMVCGMNDVLGKPANLAMIQKMLKKFDVQHKPITAESMKLYDKSTQFLRGTLGIDLPATEQELFKLDTFVIFDPKDAFKQINDESLMLELLSAFISDQMQQDIYEMQRAYAKKNWNGVEQLAHKIKGGVGYLGAQRLFYACQYLERYYKAGHRDLLDKLYHQLINVNQETIKIIAAWLNQYMKK